MFSYVCVILFTRCVYPQHALGQGCISQNAPVWRGVSAGVGVLWPSNTPPPRDGHWRGQYASYWNAFLLLIRLQVIVLTYTVSIHFPQYTKDEMRKSAYFPRVKKGFTAIPCRHAHGIGWLSGSLRIIEFSAQLVFCKIRFFFNLIPGEQV